MLSDCRYGHTGILWPCTSRPQAVGSAAGPRAPAGRPRPSPLARGAEDLRHHSDAHRSRYRAGTCDPYSQGRKITLLEVEPSIWRHSAVRLESALAKWRVLLSECDGIENRTHPY